ncbi:hypothetical protein WJX81_008260 [Elliptochloris bilobata]|uniref:Phytanoyl-CoA dioxygenase n=1 Tax=Elliptochloris bilobata TaxID=381761 RepID=A0AAW1S1N7_9CHLO
MAPEKGQTVAAGTGNVQCFPMIDSMLLLKNALCSGCWQALQERLAIDGYLLMRCMLPIADVLEARAFLLSELQRWQPQEAAVTTRYKWLRAVSPGEFTGLHTDRVFVGGSSPRLLTAWVPLGDVNIQHGPPLVCRGSHRLRAFDRLRGYAASRVGSDGTRSGWLSGDGSVLASVVGRYAVDWRTAPLRAGDVVVLGLDTYHMTACNVSSEARLSCDTRWQPAGDPRHPPLRDWR